MSEPVCGHGATRAHNLYHPLVGRCEGPGTDWFGRPYQADAEAPQPKTWKVYTPGPCFSFTGTEAEVRAHVEKSAPMLRGWTAEWVERPNGDAHYIRTNSRGKVMRGYGITVRPA